MRIEHVAFNVGDPVAMARWYVEHLGFAIVRAGDGPPYGHFLADGSGTVMVEFYCNPAAAVPDYTAIDPIVLHLALVSDDVEADWRRLLAAGATPVDPPGPTAAGDRVAMVRDPWGLAIQLARRVRPMV
ncbi:MAG: VOC family protein [Planctomycetes bacterium]|nr:VOC family protein [Planctomycetota bacterium]